MQSIAFELGIAETAYLTPSDDPTTFGLRWFSPAVEIDLCGHATLASAHALRERGVVDGTAPLTFHTRSGPLRAAFAGDRIELDFPADPVTPAPLPAALAGAVAGRRRGQRADRLLHLRGALVGRGGARLRARPGRHRLHGGQGAAADRRRRRRIRAPTTCCASSGPMWGSTRIPATGSAQCSAGPYWAAELGREDARRPPALPARRHALRAARTATGSASRGHATTVLTGELC